MKFAHFSHVWNRPGMTPGDRYDQLWRELEVADNTGYDYAFAVEHHFMPHESWMTSPTVFCTGAAAHTQNLRIGPMGYVVPLYDPIRILEETAVLDHILHGRFELGLVAGITPEYFKHYTHFQDSGMETFEKRRQLTQEVVSLVKLASCDEVSFSFQGPYHQYQDMRLSVKPQQKPHMPMWMQSRDPDTLQFLAKEGVNTGYLLFYPREEAVPRYREYLRLWDEAGHTQKPNIGYWSLVYVDETDEAALSKAAIHIRHAFSQVFGVGDGGFEDANRLVENFERRGELGSAEIARHMGDVEYLLNRNLVFVGSPDTVAARIKEAATEGLFNTFMAELNIGYLEEEDLMRSIRLFGDKVIPQLRSFEPY